MSEIINPQDAELEEIILGSCLIESKAITLIADILRPEAFYNEKNLEIYATLQSMYRNGQKIDIITVKEELARRGKLEFWKYSNKDEMEVLPEGEQEEVNVIKKIERTFNTSIRFVVAIYTLSVSFLSKFFLCILSNFLPNSSKSSS